MKPETFVPSKPRGIMGIREQGKPTFVWQRDLGNCLPLLLKNAAVLTQNMYEGNDEAMRILDTITRATAKLVDDSRKNYLANFGNMHALLEYAGKDTLGQQVYATFCSMTMISMFAYLFGCKEMAAGMPDRLDSDCYDYMIFMQMWSMLPTEKRTDFLQEIRKNNCLPGTVDLSKMFRAAEDYMEMINKAQEEILNG